MEQLICAREECRKSFIKRKHNQKYCEDECTKLATNDRIKRKYHDDKARIRGKVRWCQDCHKTKLSRYNETLTCSSCSENKIANANQSALDMLFGGQLITG